MSPSITAQANILRHPPNARPRPNPSADREIIGSFFDCLDRVVRQAVEDALGKGTQPAPTAALLSPIGGTELAVEITGLSLSRIYALVSQGGLPVSKRGNKLRFSRADLIAWVAEGKRAERKQNGR